MQISRSKMMGLSTRSSMIINQLHQIHAYFKTTTTDQSNDCEGTFHEISKNIYHLSWMDPKMITITKSTQLIFPEIQDQGNQNR